MNNRLDYVLLADVVVHIISTPSFVAQEIAKIFEEAGIEYAICGGVALGTYNYNRATEDVDFLISKKSSSKLKKLQGHGFTFRPGSKRNMYYHGAAKKIEVDILVEGDMENKICLPSPVNIREKRNGIYFVSLAMLLAMKLIANREKDVSDVRVLIQENNLNLLSLSHLIEDFPQQVIDYRKLYASMRLDKNQTEGS